MSTKYIVKFTPYLTGLDDDLEIKNSFISQHIEKIANWYNVMLGKYFSDEYKVSGDYLELLVTYYSDSDQVDPMDICDPDSDGQYPLFINGKRYRIWSTHPKVIRESKDEDDDENLSGYILFASSNRDDVKFMYPNASFSEIAKILGKMWRELPEDEKDVYYREVGKANTLRKSPNTLQKSSLDDNSGYILFASSHRDEVKQKYPDASFSEIAKILGKMWRDLSQSKKDVYNKNNSKMPETNTLRGAKIFKKESSY